MLNGRKVRGWLLVGLAMALGLVRVTALSAQGTSTTTNTVVPVTPTEFFNPCANGGKGEVIQFSGVVHILTHVSTDANGNTHIQFHTNPRGVTGIGETTGARYQGTGSHTHNFLHNGPPPFEQIFTNNFRVIGQGSANDLHAHLTFHVNVNANGVVTAFVDHFRATCN